MINDLWYKNAVIYCLSVGTYMDSNGDGIGDFKGRRLDYLHGLGVTAIWLMPFRSRRIATTATTCPTITASIRVTARSAILSNSPTARNNVAYVCSSTSWSTSRQAAFAEELARGPTIAHAATKQLDC